MAFNKYALSAFLVPDLVQRYLNARFRIGQPWRGPSQEGPTDIHTTELQVRWSYPPNPDLSRDW